MAVDDGRRALAKSMPILEVAERLGIGPLRRITATERAGACPVCGGQDRFAVNTALGVWNCRICAKGGDGLELVQHARACSFMAALDFLAGAADVPVDPAELARRRRKAEAEEKRRQDFEAQARARAIRDGREIWHAAEPGAGTLAEVYLAARGVRFARWPGTLRFLPGHAYRKHWPGQGVVEWHRGPCMIAAVQSPSGRVEAVHQTFLDPAQPGQKARIVAPDGASADEKGKPWPAKLVRGSKKGGAIRLSAPSASGVLVMGEGIETTASALPAIPSAAFWAGVDLGNMSGRQLPPEGKRRGLSGWPDLADERAFVPPPWVRRLVLIQDGDSDPEATRAKLLSCLRRAANARPGLTGAIVKAAPGRDFNDMMRGQENGN